VTSPEQPTGPLAGMRVLVLATIYAGPLIAQLLGDFGADVIKVEHPERGDGLRGAIHNSLDEPRGVDSQLDRRVEFEAVTLQHRVERLGLGDRARESIENETALRIGFTDAVLDDPDDDVVGDQRAGLHHRLGLQADRRSRLDRGAQHIAGRELRDTVFPHQPRRLSAFSGAWRPEQYQPHLFLPLSLAFLMRPSY